MNSNRIKVGSHLIIPLCIVVYLAMGSFFFYGIDLVPFHPDESSLLYQSQDLELLFTSPFELSWNPSKRADKDQIYRTLNPPFPKYILGLGRRAAGYTPEDVSTDWDWGKDWQENAVDGALPPGALLHGARAASAWMLALALLPMFLAGKAVAGKAGGVISLLVFGLNPLILLHGRRAMAEGALLFGIAFALFGVMVAHRYPWLTGMSIAVAVSTKLSVVVLFPIGLLAALWIPSRNQAAKHSTLKNGLQLVLTFTVVVFLLNPLFWSQPVGALREVWEARQSLLKRQVVEIQTFAPNQILRSPTQRTAVMISHLFIRELQFAEVNNYKEETSDSQTRYLQMPGHNLFRGYIAGGITLGLTLMGITLAARGIRSRPENQRRNLTLLLIGTILQTAALVWAIPLPFQRYYLPIIPFTSLWAAYGLISFVSVMKDTPMDRMFRAACEALTHTNNR